MTGASTSADDRSREDGRTSTSDGLIRYDMSSFSTSFGDVDSSCDSVGPVWRRRRLLSALLDARQAAIDWYIRLSLSTKNWLMPLASVWH